MRMELSLRGDQLLSLGVPRIHGVELRGATRFLPWFDTYEGDVFREFRFLGLEQRGSTTRVLTRAISDPDVMFRERRDCSGDPCLRSTSWDSPAAEADLAICFEPAAEVIDGRSFQGFKYWFEYQGSLPIHRLIDRQTWELGGNLDDVTLCLRNWLTPPRFRVTREGSYSTVGLDRWAGLLPGNLWGRWTLLPGFDMQYGQQGVLLGRFDEISLIRTVVETAEGEDALRVQDIHYFEQATTVKTNPKTILYSPDQLDAVESLNLWTRLQDREYQNGLRQFGMKDEGAPALVFSDNQWRNFRLAHSYDAAVEVAAEFGGDFVFVDAFWENGQALEETIRQHVPDGAREGTVLEKSLPGNMCVTYDFEVAKVFGGEVELKKLVERAAAKKVGILGWIAVHYHPNTALARDRQIRGKADSIFANKESGRHPDTGYPSACWPVNLHTPIFDKIRDQLLGVSERTGVAGFLWDSFCNLGWWHVDYSSDMKPQFAKMGELYADLVNAGLYIFPEAVVSFSRHSCCGLHGGNVYEGDALAFSYNTQIGLHYGSSTFGQAESVDFADMVLRGKEPFDLLFRCFAHARVPSFNFHRVPREEWSPVAVTKIKALFADYKTHRHLLESRTVLPDDVGVVWDNAAGTPLLFSFRTHSRNGRTYPAETVHLLPDADWRMQTVTIESEPARAVELAEPVGA